MALFRHEILIYGTAYIEAENEEQARNIITAHYGSPEGPEKIRLSESLRSGTHGVFLSPIMHSYGLSNMRPCDSCHVDATRAGPMPLFAHEILIHGTAYATAENEDQARKLISEHYGSPEDPEEIYLPGSLQSETVGLYLSAAMSAYGLTDTSPCASSEENGPGNAHSFRCPGCVSSEGLAIRAHIWTALSESGSDPDGHTPDHDHFWDDDHAAACMSCDWSGTVSDLGGRWS